MTEQKPPPKAEGKPWNPYYRDGDSLECPGGDRG